MTMLIYKPTIEIDCDDDGLFFAVIIDAEDDSVVHITDSYRMPEFAEGAAEDWLYRRS